MISLFISINKKLCLLTCFLFCIAKLYPQHVNTIKGRIINDAAGEPVQGCSVFINNTSKGTTTNSSGEFEIINITSGKFELIVSSVGFETYVYSFSSGQLPLELNIRLKQKVTDLPGVTVEPFLNNGWETWGQIFTETLVGTTDYANRCIIKNKEAVRFRFSKKNNQLTAIANEPLIIENRALGYLIKYPLEEFKVDFTGRTSVYLGYPLFTDIAVNSNAMKREWKDNRENAYSGSIMHFIRSLYFNEIQIPAGENEEGFEIHKHVKLPKLEKSRVKELLGDQTTTPPAPDSIKYVKKIMRQDDSLVTDQSFTAKDLTTLSADQTRLFFFTDRLSINFRRKRNKSIELQKSTIYLTTPIPASIEENGHYEPPLEIFTIGHWANSEKLANSLPLNYRPEDE